MTKPKKREEREQEAGRGGSPRQSKWRDGTQPNTFTATLNVNGPNNPLTVCRSEEETSHAQAVCKRMLQTKNRVNKSEAKGWTRGDSGRKRCAAAALSGRADCKRGDHRNERLAS